MKRIVIMFAVIFTLAGSSYAQGLKLGYINSLALLSEMPEIAVADQQIESFAQGLKGTYDNMLKEYQSKVTIYQQNAEKWTASELQLHQQALVDLETRIGKFEQSIQTDIAQKRETVYAPIIEKANTAISAVAKEDGYTYIFDASTGSLIFADESEDILDKVKAKLGL